MISERKPAVTGKESVIDEKGKREIEFTLQCNIVVERRERVLTCISESEDFIQPLLEFRASLRRPFPIDEADTIYTLFLQSLVYNVCNSPTVDSVYKHNLINTLINDPRFFHPTEDTNLAEIHVWKDAKNGGTALQALDKAGEFVYLRMYIEKAIVLCGGTSTAAFKKFRHDADCRLSSPQDKKPSSSSRKRGFFGSSNSVVQDVQRNPSHKKMNCALDRGRP